MIYRISNFFLLFKKCWFRKENIETVIFKYLSKHFKKIFNITDFYCCFFLPWKNKDVILTSYYESHSLPFFFKFCY